MKKIKWSAVAIGFLAGLGALVMGVIIFALLLALLGVQPLRSFSALHVGFPGPLTVLILDAIWIGSLLVAGYVTALLSQPEGEFNAGILGCGLMILLLFLSGFHWFELLIPPFCITGALLTRSSLARLLRRR